jgi:hypothetical protein
MCQRAHEPKARRPTRRERRAALKGEYCISRRMTLNSEGRRRNLKNLRHVKLRLSEPPLRILHSLIYRCS